MAQLLPPPWCDCIEVEAGTRLGVAPGDKNPGKGQRSIHGSSTVVGILLVLRCVSIVFPWDAAPGTGRGKFGASLPQSSPKGKITLYPKGWRLSQILRSASEKLPEWDCVSSNLQTFVGCAGAH